MELTHLKAFVAIAKEGNLTRAAKKLYLTQPALSAQISGLEKELGMKLFYRGSKGMSLSSSGEKLLEKAKEVLKVSHSFCNSAMQMSGEIKGSVHCSFNIDSSLLCLSDLVSGLSEDAPQLIIGFKQVISSYVIDHLKNMEIEMGFILGDFYECPPDMDFVKLWDFHVALVAPPTWKEQLENVKEEDLAAYPFILLPSYCPYQRTFEDFIKKNNIKATLYADHEDAISELVSKEKGISLLLYEDAIRKPEKLYAIEKYLFPISLNLYFRKEIKDDPACEFVIKQIINFWKQKS